MIDLHTNLHRNGSSPLCTRYGENFGILNVNKVTAVSSGSGHTLGVAIAKRPFTRYWLPHAEKQVRVA